MYTGANAPMRFLIMSRRINLLGTYKNVRFSSAVVSSTFDL